MVRGAIQPSIPIEQHCLISADAIYEPDWRSGKAVPTQITKADGEPMGIAGLWSWWQSPEGEVIHSYLYRGVIAEKDILRCENGQVTYRWHDSKTGKPAQRSVTAVEFLRLVLQHVLPKGFRRARNYGFLHPNSKRLIALLRLLVFKPCGKVPTQLAQATQTERPKLLCRCCGDVMAIVRRRILQWFTAPARANREDVACA